MKQKLTVFLLMIYCCLLFSGIHSVSAATSGTCGDNLIWTLNDAGTLTISGTGDMTSWTSSTSVPWYSNRSKVKKVVIGNSVTSIGEYAFAWCESLTSVTIGDSVTNIGNYAFYDCTSLTSVTIGDSVTTIGDYAFGSCISLTSITIGDSVTTIGDYAFCYCTSLTSVTIGNSVTSIGDYAFRNCDSLTSITIPDSVTSIGEYAFRSCYSLTSIIVDDNNANFSSLDGNLFDKNHTTLIQYAIGKTETAYVIPDSVTSIGKDAFSDCTSLTSITIPDSVTSIGYWAFDSCTSLTDVYYHGTKKEWNGISIGYGNTSLESATRHYAISVTLLNPDGTEYAKWTQLPGTALAVDKIPATEGSSMAVYKDSDMTQEYDFDTIINEDTVLYVKVIVIVASGTCGDNLTWTLDNAGTLTISGTGDMYSWFSSSSVPWYSNRSYVKNVVINNSVTRIGDYAFWHCSSLTSITIPDSVTRIGSSAFEKCYSLTSVTIPDSVTSIGYETFRDCTSLTSITIPDSVTSIGYETFRDCTRLTNVTIPDSVTSIGQMMFSNCDSLTSITIPDSVTSIGGSAFSGCTGLTSITIPDSVTTIGEWAFSDCTGLTSITIPDSVTTIGERAFYDCDSLTSITIPDSVTRIGNFAFYYCRSLTSITIPDSVTSISWGAFSDCTSLTSVTIGNSVTSIGDSAFYYCRSLTSITIPDSVTSIGEEAFQGCGSLTNVYYNGTEEEWKSIYIYRYNTPLTSATRHYFSYVTLLNPDGTEYAKWMQPMGTALDLDKIPVAEGSSIFVYKDIDRTQEYDFDTIINEDTVLYVIGEHIAVLGVQSAEIGTTDVVQSVSLMTTNNASVLYCYVKYPNRITLTDVVARDFYYAGLEDQWEEDGFVTSVILAQYSDTDWIPTKTLLNPFDLVFTIPTDASLQTVEITMTEDTFLSGNDIYYLENRYSNSLEITPKLADSILITGEDTLYVASQYMATVFPDYATDKTVIWSIDHEDIATIDQNGIVTPVTAGAVTITATATDGSGVFATKEITVEKLAESIEIVGEDTICGASQYTATVFPDYIIDKTVIWSIDNEDIAIIDQNGIVTPVTAGTITITATAADGSGVSATKEITVKKLAESIEIVGEDTIYGASQYTATVFPDYTTDKTVIWSIDHEEIATIDQNGIVTPVTSGTVTITATAADGSGVFATKEIMVEKLAESIEIVGETEIFEPTQYTVTVLPDYTTNQNVVWTVSDDRLATVDENGLVTPLKNGTIVLTATTTDGSGITATHSIVITVSVRANSITSDLGFWDEEFDPDITEYTVYVSGETTAVYFTSSFQNATLKVNGSPAANGVRKRVSLSGETTRVTLELKPVSTNTLLANTYTVNVVKFDGIKAKLSEDKKQLEVQPFGISEGSKILVAFYQNGKFQQVQPETYKGEALFFPVNQTYTDIKIMAWQNFDTLKSLCVPAELPIQ